MSNNYYEQDISKRAKVIGSSYDNIDVRCSGDACNFDQVKYDSHLNSPGPTRWASYPTLPDKDGKCKDEWLQFDWSDDKGSGYKIDMVSVLYGLYSFEFDGSKVIANTTLPSISVTPPKPANAPANYTVTTVDLVRPDLNAKSFSQNSGYTIFNVTLDQRFDLFMNYTGNNTKAMENVAKLRIDWKGLVPSGYFVPKVCQMDVEKIFIAGKPNAPLIYQEGGNAPIASGNINSSGGDARLSGGAIAAIILVPMVIIVPLVALYVIRQKNIQRRRAAAALRTQRIG